MTAHMMERIAERFPGRDPAEVEEELRSKLARGAWLRIGQHVAGETVAGVRLRSGEAIFASVTAAGAIRTVLSEGMVVPLTDGEKGLSLPGNAAGLFDLPGPFYHADPCPEPSLSSSLARTMLQKSPLHAWIESERLNPDRESRDSDAFDVGRAAHREVLGAGSDYSIIPDELLDARGALSKKEAKEWRDAERAAGRTPIKRAVAEEVRALSSSISKRIELSGIDLTRFWKERTAIARIGGVMCRAMLDAVDVEARVIIDLKTTDEATPEACVRSIRRYGYHVQRAHYVETVAAATGTRAVDWTFIFAFVEKGRPHEGCLIRLDQPTAELGAFEVARARARWAECVRQDKWPGYPYGIAEVGLPAWEHERAIERNLREQDAEARKPSAEEGGMQ